MVTQLLNHLSLVGGLFPNPLEAFAFSRTKPLLLSTTLILRYVARKQVSKVPLPMDFDPNAHLKFAGSISLRTLIL